MKEFVRMLLLLLLLVLMPLKAMAESDSIILQGFDYEESKHEISNVDQFSNEIKITDYSISEGFFNFSGSLYDEDQEYYFSNRGKIVDSVTSIYNDKNSNNVTIDLEDNDNELQVISFTVEEKAHRQMLLPVNEHLENSIVIKVALHSTETNTTFYFEGELEDQDLLKELITNSYNLQSQISSIDSKEDLSHNELELLNELQKEREEIAANELWFTYLTKESEKEILTSNEDYGLLEDDEISMFSTSSNLEIPGIQNDEFQKLRTRLVQSNNSHGYYKDAEELEYGSGNILSRVIRWTWIGNAPDDLYVPNNHISTDRNAELRVTHSSKYLYRAEDRELILLDEGGSDFYLKDTKLVVGLSNNVGILNDITTFSNINGSNVNIDTGALIGLLPIGQWYSNIRTLYNSIQLEPESLDSGRESYTYYATLAENEQYLGNIPRVFEVNIDKEMRTPGDHLGLNYKIISPHDMEERSRTGYKSVRFYFSFDVYEKVTTVSERLLGEVEREFGKGFYIRESE